MEPMNGLFHPMPQNFKTKCSSIKPTIPILSIYGGGTRGIIPIKVMKEITVRSGMEPAEAFQLLSGTSIGGIEVSILNIKNKEDKPAITIDQFDRCFAADAKTIFPAYSRFNPYRMLYPEYDRKGLHEVLFKYVGDALISDGLKDILIPTICDEYRSTWYFTRNKIIHLDPERKLYQYHKEDAVDGLKLTDVLEATSAAPTYFEKKQINIGGTAYNFRDGGLSTNNPCLSAYSYAYHHYEANADYLVCTIGTGKTKTLSSSSWDKISYAYWGAEFASYSIEATQESANVSLSEILGKNLYIFQTEIQEQDDTVDDTSEEHFKRMEDSAKAMLDEEGTIDQLEVLCAKLEDIADTEVS